MSASEAKSAWLQPARGDRFILDGNCRIGRVAGNQLVINTANVSRHHAAIHSQEPDEFLLIDLDSANGTFLNGHRLLRPTRLRDGDRLTIGEATFIFRQIVSVTPNSRDTAANIPTILEFREQLAWLLIADLKDFSEMIRNEEAGAVAIRLMSWFSSSQRIIEQRGGQIAKNLGDGFFAYWTLTDGGPEAVADTLRDLHRQEHSNELNFRFAVHYGLVTFGAAAKVSDGLMGVAVNYTFRLEKLASALGLPFCLSEAAQEKLAPHLPINPVDGEHELKGFPGRHRCFQIAWPPS